MVSQLDRPPHLVVSPGQTVFHDVRDGRCYGTLQLGQPAWVAERTGLPVVSDLRARDVAAGGHGAPLASTLDGLWLAGPGGPRAALNLGGIANVTVVGDEGQAVQAWDTGPANCLLDLAAHRVTDGRPNHDVDGHLARQGAVRDDLLALLLAPPVLGAVPAAGSTGREAFSAGYLDAVLDGLPRVSGPDLLATLTGLPRLRSPRGVPPYDVHRGGGLRWWGAQPCTHGRPPAASGAVPLVTSDERGLPADAKEVVLWALLGFLAWHRLPGSTAATGARRPGCSAGSRPGGAVAPARARRQGRFDDCGCVRATHRCSWPDT